VRAVSTTAPTDFPTPEVDPNGVDLAQVRRMLALTPVERLRCSNPRWLQSPPASQRLAPLGSRTHPARDTLG
jgi:hypothetical protein